MKVICNLYQLNSLHVNYNTWVSCSLIKSGGLESDCDNGGGGGTAESFSTQVFATPVTFSVQPYFLWRLHHGQYTTFPNYSISVIQKCTASILPFFSTMWAKFFFSCAAL